MDPSVVDALTGIAGSGVIGAILVIVLVAYSKKDRAYQAVQEARVQDARKVISTVLEMQEKWQATLVALERAVDRLVPPGGRE